MLKETDLEADEAINKLEDFPLAAVHKENEEEKGLNDESRSAEENKFFE
jgi:hypothetical protein